MSTRPHSIFSPMKSKLAISLICLLVGLAVGYFVIGRGTPAAGAAAEKDPVYPHLESRFDVVGTSDWQQLGYENFVQLVRLRYGQTVVSCILFNHDQDATATGASFSCPDKLNR